MLTLITGTPGAGKTLFGVWEIARHVPESTIEVQGEAKPRRLLTNIKDMQYEHTVMNVDDLNGWHTWAKPGDVIVYDEVQEAWRPRGMSVKVPDCIQALETHRHMGVDIVLITQHPMLLDQNVRRLVNRHIHVRRITGLPFAVYYEWDHCSNPGQTKTAHGMKPWRYPKVAYTKYKSATAHTKQKAKLSLPVLGLIGALCLLGWAGPNAYARYNERYNEKPVAKAPTAEAPKAPASRPAAPPVPVTIPERVVVAQAPAEASSAPTAFAGCIRMRDQCKCVSKDTEVVEKPKEFCEERTGSKAPDKLATHTPQWEPQAVAGVRVQDLEMMRVAEQYIVDRKTGSHGALFSSR